MCDQIAGAQPKGNEQEKWIWPKHTHTHTHIHTPLPRKAGVEGRLSLLRDILVKFAKKKKTHQTIAISLRTPCQQLETALAEWHCEFWKSVEDFKNKQEKNKKMNLIEFYWQLTPYRAFSITLDKSSLYPRFDWVLKRGWDNKFTTQ